MKPADLLIIIGGDAGCPRVILPLHRPFERISKYRRAMPAIWVPGSEAFRTIVRYERSKAVADISPSTENVRAMLNETLGRLRKASEEYFGLLEKGLSSSPLQIADQAKQFCNIMQRNVNATFDLGEKLSQAKDTQEALKIQSEFFQDQMRAMTDQAKSMGESAMKAATGVFIPKR